VHLRSDLERLPHLLGVNDAEPPQRSRQKKVKREDSVRKRDPQVL